MARARYRADRPIFFTERFARWSLGLVVLDLVVGPARRVGRFSPMLRCPFGKADISVTG